MNVLEILKNKISKGTGIKSVPFRFFLNQFVELRQELPKKINLILTFIGVFLIIFLWHLIAKLFPSPNVPSPIAVILCFAELHWEDALIRNLFYSIKINSIGYFEAILISIPIGFIIGLLPIMNGLFSKQIEAMRFIPLTALTGLFIAWFGIEDAMKIHFLAFGIIVYLLPMVVIRVKETERIYEQTVKTLGANTFQTIKKVYIPSVMSKIIDDIRVLVAISWTYIIVAELVNKTGGIGAMIFTQARQSNIDKVFALLIVIVVIGFIQDKLFKILDKIFFGYKYV